jgi:hypothetical protein
MIAASQGQYDSAAGLFQELIAVGQGQDRSRGIDWLSILKADTGKLDEEGSNDLSNAIDMDREAGEGGLASQKMVALAFVEGLAGNPKLARAWILQAVALRPSTGNCGGGDPSRPSGLCRRRHARHEDVPGRQGSQI